MRFSFTDDHLALRDAARDLFAKECGPEVVRAAWDAPAGGLDRGIWRSLASMGVLSVLVPEAAGGLGLDDLSLVLVLEESGRVALPHPIVETAAVAAPLLGAALGDRMVSTDLGGRAVPCAADADALLLAGTGPGLTLVDRGDPAAQLDALDTVDRSRRAASVTLVAGLDAATRVTDDPDVVRAAWSRGVLGTAAQLVGLGQAMLDMTVNYVKDRHQFGVPVGSFQAVKHHLADAARHLAFARPAVYRAAYSLAHGAPAQARDVAMAKAMASDAACLVGRKALQCHGAMGYTVEYDLHLYLKRAWALARAWGDPATHRDTVAATIGLMEDPDA